jgi:RNA polymerase sigma-70 factor, ECF subfamily
MGDMPDNDSFADLMARLRIGEGGAAREVFERYARALVALARERLSAGLRKKVDPEDVVQSVYRSFFVRYGAGQFDLEAWSDLWSLLTVITLRKCLNQVKYHQRERRRASREVPLAPRGDDSAAGWEVPDREPTPEEAAVLTETVEGLLRDLGPAEREIIELSLQGHTAPEIKQRLGRSERTVRRVRERVRHRLERVGDGQAD